MVLVFFSIAELLIPGGQNDPLMDGHSASGIEEKVSRPNKDDSGCGCGKGDWMMKTMINSC